MRERLEDNLAGKLHGTSVIQEFLVRPIEEALPDSLEVIARGEAGTVNIVDGSRLILGVIEDVECLRAEFERVVLEHCHPLVSRQINVIDRTQGQGIASRVGK